MFTHAQQYDLIQTTCWFVSFYFNNKDDFTIFIFLSIFVVSRLIDDYYINKEQITQTALFFMDQL